MRKKKQCFKRFLGMLLSLVMCVSSVQLQPLDVQAASGYTEVTSLEEVKAGGDFVLVAESGENAYALGTTIAQKILPTDFNASGSDMPIWKVEANGDGVSLLAGENSYLAYKSGTDFQSLSEAYSWSVSKSDAGFRFLTSGEENRAIAYQAGTVDKFGAYITTNSGNKNYTFDLKVYKAASDAGEEGGSGEGGGEETVVNITELTPTASSAENLTVGTEVTFSLQLDGKDVDGVVFETSSNEQDWTTAENAKYTIPEGEAGDHTLYVRARLDDQVSQTLELTYKIEDSGEAEDDSVIKDGTYVIYDATNRKAATALASDKFYGYLQTVTVTVDNESVIGYDATAAWTITNVSDGNFTIKDANGRYVYMSGTYNSFNVSDTQPESGHLWTAIENTDGTVTIKNVEKEKYISYDETYFSFGAYAEPSETQKDDLTLIAYVTPDDGNGDGEGEGGSTGESEITDGTYVIWAPAYQKALSANYGSSYYNPGVDVIENGDTISGYGSTEVWTVTKLENGYYTISYNGQNIGMGDSFSSMPLGETHDKWTLEDAGDGLWYVKNIKRSAYMEWYAKNNYWSGYSKIAAGNEGMFALKFTPVAAPAKEYPTDTSVVETIAQWGGGGPYDETANATTIQGDKLDSNDQKDTTAKYTIVANGQAAAPYSSSKSNSTGSTSYYMGGKGIGSGSGDYMQFAVSTVGYGDMSLFFRLRASKTAPGTFQLQYSTDDGATFENFTTGEYSYKYKSYNSAGESYQVDGKGSITDGIAQTSKAPGNYITFNFDVPAGADHIENLIIRLVPGTIRADKNTAQTISSSGTIRIDSVVLSGSPIVDNSITGYVTVNPDATEDQAVGTALTMTSATEGAKIVYRFDEGEWKDYNSEAKPVLEKLPTVLEVKATCEDKADSITRILKYVAGSVAPVKMTPNGGGVYIKGETATVTLSCDTAGATIYYKQDGAEEFTEYTEPITLNKGFSKTVILAYAVKEGLKDGTVVSRTFTERNSDTYNIYFGQLHSHTSYSDGAGTAKEAFEHASNVKNLDFLAVTDHSNSFDNEANASIGNGSMSEEWKELGGLAKEYTTDDFVGLYGYEMTWSNGLGHMNTFNTPGFQSRTQKEFSTYSTALQNYYAALKTQPDSINQFNHPGTTFGDFSDFAYYDEEIDDLITIVEVGNGEGAIGSSGYFPSYEYYTRALDKGWHVAPTNNQDNHKGLWGDANTGRSVVLADSLNETDIYDAMRNYRVYATEDNDLSIMYTLDGNMMGSQLARSDVGEIVDIEVTLNDPTDDVIGKVEVIVNGGLSVASKQVDGNSDTVKFSLPANYSYYYIKVTQNDRDIAVTAPVWVGEVEAAGISDFSTSAALAVQNEELDLKLDLYNNEKSDLLIEEITFTIGENVIHTADLTNLKVVNSMGTASYGFNYKHAGLGQTIITANVKASLNGVERTYQEPLKLNYVSEEMVTKVIIDGTHDNDYVTGYYGGNMGNFTKIAADSQVDVKVVKDQITAEMLKDCSLLVVSAPARATGTSNAGDYAASAFENDFIIMVADYVKNGGSVVVCGLADYQDKKAASADGHAAAQLNKLLKGIGATLSINDDEAYDEENNGGQAYRLYPTTFNKDSKWAAGIAEDQKYSQYSGCTVDYKNAKENDTVYAGQWIVNGFDTTFSVDSDKDGTGALDKEITTKDGKYIYKLVADYGNATFIAAQDTKFGGTIFAAGGVFISDFEVKAEVDNAFDLPYANKTIAENILNAVKVELPLSTIAEMRAAKFGEVFRIVGYATSNRNEGTAFFDAMYLQDETGGITVFPITEDGNIQIGTKMEIVGSLEHYQGDLEIQVISYKILDEEPYVYAPEKVSNKEAMDYEKNGGKLLQIEGEVVEVAYAKDGEGVNEFVVKDKNGDLAKVFIDGYILSSKTGKNTLAFLVKKGNVVSAAGISYLHPEGESEKGVCVLRVRDCEEILLVKEGGGSGAGGNSGTGGGSSSGGSSKPGSGPVSSGSTNAGKPVETIPAPNKAATTDKPTAGGAATKKPVIGNDISEKPVDTKVADETASEKVVNIVKETVTAAEGKVFVSEEAVNKVIEVTKKGSAVILPLKEAVAADGQLVTAAVIPVVGIEKIAEADAAMILEFEAAKVKLSTDCIKAIMEQAKGTTIEIRLKEVDSHELNENQKKALDGHGVEICISVQIFCNDEYIGDFKGGRAMLTIPFTPKESTNGEDYKVYYIADDGQKVLMPSKYANGSMVVEVDHFSEYAIVYEAEDAQTEDTKVVVDNGTMEAGEEVLDKNTELPIVPMILVIVVFGVIAAGVVFEKRKKE